MIQSILVVDDDPDILASTSSVLQKRGFRILEASDGETALEILRSEHPDLVVTDVLLPRMNGYEFVKEIRAGIFTSDIPILVITGRGQMKESFDVIGVNGFIQKPFSPEELIRRIQEIDEVAALAQGQQIRMLKKVFILGRADEKEQVSDIQSVLAKAGLTTFCSFSVSDAVAKTVDYDPDIFLVDVQLDGRSSAEFVMIVRRLPRCEEKPIIGFSYYNVSDLSNDARRKQIACIEDDAEKFLKSGASRYIGRYSSEGLITALKEIFKPND